MFRHMLRSKIHRATVTRTCLEYEGSLTVDEDLLDAADILPYEAIVCSNLNNGGRFLTHAINGARGGGEIILNGPTAKGRPGIKSSSSVMSTTPRKRSSGTLQGLFGSMPTIKSHNPVTYSLCYVTSFCHREATRSRTIIGSVGRRSFFSMQSKQPAICEL
jgi:hypothetical protein